MLHSLIAFWIASSSAPASAPAVYPQAWVFEAMHKNGNNSCQQLVYKKGCAVLRTGKIFLHVTLDDAGKVETLTVTKNAIRRDPKLVEKCARESVKKWQFHPPEGVSNEVDFALILSDKC